MKEELGSHPTDICTCSFSKTLDLYHPDRRPFGNRGCEMPRVQAGSESVEGGRKYNAYQLV